MANKTPIDELFTDAGPFDLAAAAQALKVFVAIQRETHRIYLKGGQKLSVENKILAYTLAKKLLKMEERIEEEYVSAAEVHEATGIKKGSVDFTFKKLREAGILIGSGSRYELPHYQVNVVIERLNSAANKSE